MPTLVERVREVVSAESDDFFSDDTILFYLNRVQDKIISFAINKEIQVIKANAPIRSFRCLDGLRTSTDFDITTLTVVSYDDYYKTTVTTPADLKQYSFMRYKTSCILRELSDRELHELEFGNKIPTPNEGYLHFTGGDIDVYLNEDLSGGTAATNYIFIYYIKNPTALTTVSETMAELPDYLENALIYGAASMMVMQESVENPEARTDLFIGMYQDELTNNIY